MFYIGFPLFSAIVVSFSNTDTKFEFQSDWPIWSKYKIDLHNKELCNMCCLPKPNLAFFVNEVFVYLSAHFV
jgi:hypothetical protein